MTNKLYLDNQYLRRFTSAVSHIIETKKRPGKFPNTEILFGASAEGKASLFFLRPGEVTGDMGKLMQEACSVIDGRGGGRPQQAQGGGPATDKLGLALQCAYEEVVGGFK